MRDHTEQEKKLLTGIMAMSYEAKVDPALVDQAYYFLSFAFRSDDLITIPCPVCGWLALDNSLEIFCPDGHVTEWRNKQ